ncbi:MULTISPECIES: hypothetical protein [Marinobacter]|uniref:DUF1090 domain-containing protein n=1 Tax=Marinobacter profundi TaxID=2666256 RepID=A0A2G1UQR6_9GAMM|nr:MULTISPECIES: hypothetical protein [Marinobacter]MBD3655645.1 hypothetical protein [Marinobacter sp.]PHQ16812.1 hypothetical protein CLH61_02230 [Marinobacter profundi]
MRYLAALVITLFMAGTAMASQCPSLVGKIDQQLQSAQLDSETEANIKALRDEGEALHNQGKHAESVKVLKEALEKLDAAS